MALTSAGFSPSVSSLTSMGILLLLLGASGCDGSGSLGGPGSGGSSVGAGGASVGGSASGGAVGVGGASSGGGVGSGGAPSGGSTAASGGEASGGVGGGVGGNPAGGGDGSGGAGGGGECTRELLQGALDAYLDALEAHDPSTLPLSASLKFTENAEVLEIGEAGLWTTAGTVVHVQRALDVAECTVAAHAVIPDGATDVPVAIRIKLVGAEILEIETIVARPGDYAAETNDPDAIVAIADEVGWDTAVPDGQQNAREEIIAWMDKYFRQFPSGVCATSSECIRLENGGGNYPCAGLGAQCSSDPPGPDDNNLEPRLILADVELGIGVGLTIYNGHTDMHMFKMVGGEVLGVHVVLSHSDGMSGWD